MRSVAFARSHVLRGSGGGGGSRLLRARSTQSLLPASCSSLFETRQAPRQALLACAPLARTSFRCLSTAPSDDKAVSDASAAVGRGDTAVGDTAAETPVAAVEDAQEAQTPVVSDRERAAGYIEAIRSANGLKAKMEVYQKIKDADGLDARVTTNMLHSNVTRNGNVTAEQNANIELLLADAQAEGIQLSVKLLEALLTKLKEKRPNPTNQTLAVLLKDRFWELGSSLDTNIYNILLSLTMRHNNHKTPEVAATMRTSQVYPNEHSYNILIESSTRSRQTSKAMNYLDQMLKMRHQPKVICVLKIIDLCITQGDVANARTCFHSLEAFSKPRGLAIDSSTALKLANLAARQGELEFMAEVRKHVQAAVPVDEGAPDAWGSPFLHAELSCALVAGTGGAAEVEEGAKAAAAYFDVVEQFDAAGLTIEWTMLQRVGAALGVAEAEVDEAYFELERRKQQDSAVPIDAVNAVILGCVELKDVGRAIETFDTINSAFGLQPNARSYSAVLSCCLAADQIQGAVSFVNEIKQRKVAPDGPLFSTMISTMAHESLNDARYLGKIKEALAAMKALKLQPSSAALEATARASARHKRFQPAWDTVKLMKELGQPIPRSLIAFIRAGGKDAAAKEPK